MANHYGLDFTGARDDGVAVGSAGPYAKPFAPPSRQITTLVPHHSVSTGRMPFLPPNQQRQSTQGILRKGCSRTAEAESGLRRQCFENERMRRGSKNLPKCEDPALRPTLLRTSSQVENTSYKSLLVTGCFYSKMYNKVASLA